MTLPELTTHEPTLAEQLKESRSRLCRMNKKYRKVRRLFEHIRHSYELELSFYRETDRKLAEQDGRLQVIKPKKQTRRKSVTKRKEFVMDLDKLLVGLSNDQQQLVRQAMHRQGLC